MCVYVRVCNLKEKVNENWLLGAMDCQLADLLFIMKVSTGEVINLEYI
jgi:hypothetical protein